MRRALCVFFISFVMAGSVASAEDNRSHPAGTAVVPEKYVPLGSEDGYFSAEDYKNLKQSYERKDTETKTVIQTGRGRRIMIREKQTDAGVNQVQILDTGIGKAPDIILVPGGTR